MILVRLVEAVDVLLLPAEALDHSDARDVLLYAGVDVGDCVPDPFVAGAIARRMTFV